MIYTVTLAGDKDVDKSVEISLILKKLNIDSVVTGISLGEHPAKDELDRAGIKHHFIEQKTDAQLDLFNDNSVKVETKLQQEFLDYLKENLKMGDILLVAGEFANGIDPVYLVDMATIAAKAMVHLVVDVPYDTVLDILPLHPLLIKPNQAELKNWYNKKGKNLSIKEEIELAHDMVVQGADHVLLSLGENGAAIVNLMHAYLADAPEVELKNDQGSGETLLATFLAGMLQNHMPVRNLADSIAAASDTVRSEGLTDFENVPELQKLIIAEKITFEEAQ